MANLSLNHLRNVESTSSMANIMILIIDKPSRRGANNRCQVLVIGTKTCKSKLPFSIDKTF